MQVTPIRRLIHFFALVPLAGCGDEIRTPKNVAGEYVITEVEGKPLPATELVMGKDEDCKIKLVRVVFTLREDGTYSRTYESGEACAEKGKEPPEPTGTELVTMTGRFELRGPKGDSILFLNDVWEGFNKRAFINGKHMTMREGKDRVRLKRID